MGGGRRHGRQDKSRGSRDCKSGLVVGRRGRKVSCGTFAGASVAEFFPVGCDSESTGGERRHSGEHERWGAVEAEVSRQTSDSSSGRPSAAADGSSPECTLAVVTNATAATITMLPASMKLSKCSRNTIQPRNTATMGFTYA